MVVFAICVASEDDGHGRWSSEGKLMPSFGVDDYDGGDGVAWRDLAGMHACVESRYP